MNYRILISTSFAFFLLCSVAYGQVGRRLQDAAAGAAERAATRQTERRTEQAVDKAIDGIFDGNNNNNQNQQQQNQQNQQNQQEQPPANSGSANTTPVPAATPAPEKTVKALEMTYAKNDFVPGDEIFFEDLMDNERLGEFPSMWDLYHGAAEIASIDGKKAIVNGNTNDTYVIMPLMKEMSNYLPEAFTIEMDLWLSRLVRTEDRDALNKFSYSYSVNFFAENGYDRIAYFQIDNFDCIHAPDLGQVNMHWNYISTSGASVSGNATTAITASGWHHLSISFNQRAFKVYLDGTRYANIPNMAQPANFRLHDNNINGNHWGTAVTNVRIAKGAVPLYDRMLSDGKFITYGITFDIGKSTIKPESMGEINRIVELMKQNPDLKFSVEGHTDSTGSAATNQTLSEARSQAVVDKLVENGIAADRLKAAGKGQTSPIADNGTDEGRAKNRRVEFVKN